MANLVNLERVSKSYGIRPLLTDVSLGVSLGERIGIVGRNGDGKTTLLEVMAGLEEPDAGRVSRALRPPAATAGPAGPCPAGSGRHRQMRSRRRRAV